jgi:hypothetical protein
MRAWRSSDFDDFQHTVEITRHRDDAPGMPQLPRPGRRLVAAGYIRRANDTSGLTSTGRAALRRLELALGVRA